MHWHVGGGVVRPDGPIANRETNGTTAGRTLTLRGNRAAAEAAAGQPPGPSFPPTIGVGPVGSVEGTALGHLGRGVLRPSASAPRPRVTCPLCGPCQARWCRWPPYVLRGPD